MRKNISLLLVCFLVSFYVIHTVNFVLLMHKLYQQRDFLFAGDANIPLACFLRWIKNLEYFFLPSVVQACMFAAIIFAVYRKEFKSFFNV